MRVQERSQVEGSPEDRKIQRNSSPLPADVRHVDLYWEGEHFQEPVVCILPYFLVFEKTVSIKKRARTSFGSREIADL